MSEDLASRLFREFTERRFSGEDVEIDEYASKHPDLADELRKRHAQWLLVERGLRSTEGVRLVGDREPEKRDEELAKYLDELRRRGASFDRYVVISLLGKGAQGRVYEVFDKDLRRALAMKVLDRDLRSVDVVALARFLDEAQVMAQLDHPGIVPVHDVGIDPDQRLFFTMKLVRGETLSKVYERLRLQDPETTPTRVLGYLLNVCNAVAYAHERKVIHRDLKPDNILIGAHGETHVLDWGLKRLLDAPPDAHDVMPRPTGGSKPAVDSLRRELIRTKGSPIGSLPDGIAGTLYYMSPEQARGEQHAVRETTDIYAIGAMLYELLAPSKPYADGDEAFSVDQILLRIRTRPPTPLHRLAPNVAPELEAIVEHAMHRDPEQRYPSMSALADDLRNFLEGRVVNAFETGAWAQARKWVGRNRKLAIAFASTVLTIVASTTLFGVFERRHNRDLSQKNTQIAEAMQRVTSLSDRRILENMLLEADSLWPIDPALSARIRDWIGRAETLASRLPEHEGNLRAVAQFANPQSDKELERERRLRPAYNQLRVTVDEIRRIEYELSLPSAVMSVKANLEKRRASAIEKRARLEQEIEDSLRASPSSRVFWSFGNDKQNWQVEQLADLIRNLRSFADPASGTIVAMKSRLAQCEEIQLATLDRLEQAWKRTLDDIASAPDSPYDGMSMRPQLGLVPLGPDPVTRFQEFAVFGTGDPPVRDPDHGRLEMRRDSAMVLVLLPGGTFHMGAVPPDPLHPERVDNLDPGASRVWGPVHSVTLSPFFISKFEMTQGQWERLYGGRPSTFSNEVGDRPLPVERISYLDCERLLPRVSLEMPTEAQWEYAARGGRSSRFWCGNDESRLSTCGNIADHALKESASNMPWQFREWSDGIAETGAVDSLEPNPFGLHLVIGNVAEWCRDGSGDEVGSDELTSYELPTNPGDGLRLYVTAEKRVARGGAYQFVPNVASSAARAFRLPDYRASTQGVRPVRSIDP